MGAVAAAHMALLGHGVVGDKGAGLCALYCWGQH